MNRIRVKICGIKDLLFALKAVECGADAIGFVFYEKSPRFIEVDKAGDIIKNLPAFVNKVGVFVNHNISEILRIVEKTGIDTIQLHGEYDINFLKNLKSYINLPIIYAIRIEAISDFKIEDDVIKELTDNASNILIDKLDKKEYGGTGKSIFFDEGLNENSKDFISKKVILAGGINKENISHILGFIKPYGIDVSSGVEIKKGEKDKKLLEEFFEVFYRYSILR
ncbi:MAG: phosphoribosylanthranilate isomerase [Brevinematia bacterium]